MKNARLLSRALERSGYYTVLSDVHRPAESTGAGLIANMRQAVTNEEDIEVR